MEFAHSIQLSPHRRLEGGALVCEACRVANVGSRKYTSEECPNVKPKDGWVTVVRSKESLFSEETLKSFDGVPITLEHPPGAEMIGPETWKKWIVGTAFNARQGTGEDAGCLVMDLRIYDPTAIEAVQSGAAEELSAGFYSEVRDAGDGVGVEGPLRGNHVALVPAGRCGPMCAVKDSAPTSQETTNMDWFKKKDAETDAGATGAPATSATPEEVIKALQDQVASLTEQLKALQEQKTDEDPKAEDPGTEEKKTDEDPQAAPASAPEGATAQDPKEIIRQMIREALAEHQAMVDSACEVKKDAAAVAPALDPSTPDLAMAALAEFAKTAFGKGVIAQYGGLQAIRKDSAPSVLKACAVAKRMSASSFYEGRKDAESAPASSDFFAQAKKLWHKE